MAWHGMAASPRIERGAARRGGIPVEFPRNDYGPAGEKNPTPPNRKSVLGFREKKKFSIRKSGGHLQLGGSDFLHMQGHSLCCEIQGYFYTNLNILWDQDRSGSRYSVHSTISRSAATRQMFYFLKFSFNQSIHGKSGINLVKIARSGRYS